MNIRYISAIAGCMMLLAVVKASTMFPATKCRGKHSGKLKTMHVRRLWVCMRQ